MLVAMVSAQAFLLISHLVLQLQYQMLCWKRYIIKQKIFHK